MNFLLSMHSRLLFTILLVFGVLMLWGIVDYLRGARTRDLYRALLAIGELLVVSEFVIGTLLLLNGRQPARSAMHIVYGVVAVATVPLVYGAVRRRDTRYEQLIYAFMCLFICAIILRALATGRG